MEQANGKRTNIITYPPNKIGWGLVCKLKDLIQVTWIGMDMDSVPELALVSGEHYVGYEAIQAFIDMPRPADDSTLLPNSVFK